MYLVKSPLLLKWFYSALTWNKSRSQKIVYLTFDDGPIPNVTEFVLNTLKSFKIKATFFCIGDNILKHPDLFERLKSEGHAIGNHTFNHLNGWKTDNKTYLQNF
ncbi:MAG TPA: polysaccharide deacetylase family protein, partial [Pedobacter sp.]|nr:polysaccharide deacetylase family protein [Pedobacter sp.]